MSFALVVVVVMCLLSTVLYGVENGSVKKSLIEAPKGLLSWIFDKNWAAKVGGIMLTIGGGALVRLMFIDLDYPPTVKLLTGVIALEAPNSTLFQTLLRMDFLR